MLYYCNRCLEARRLFMKILKYLESALVFGFFAYVIYIFYSIPDRNVFGTPNLNYKVLLDILYVTLITDGLMLLLHLFRKPVKHKRISFDPKKLSVLIACYNGEDVIAETIQHALMKVPAPQIIVASDGSTDRTVEIAKSYGVTVLDYPDNLSKSFTINRAIHHVKTEYVLLLDDDTLIGHTEIPTSLLDDGYNAVSFNVIPVKTGSLLNKLQTFEYAKSMTFGKSLRGGVGGVGNVSGAIGLYRTADLVKQDGHHSGQYGGEDQQRTMFVHLFEKGKGVTYIDSPVYTKVPATLGKLTKQRSKSWNMSLNELFWLNLKVVFNPRANYILKIDKMYHTYILLTDPLRLAFVGFVIYHPITFGIIYLFYVLLGITSWFRIGRRSPIWIVLIFPIYSKYLFFCRCHAVFHWYNVKRKYIFHKGHHKRVYKRALVLEYIGTAVVYASIWTLTLITLYRNLPI